MDTNGEPVKSKKSRRRVVPKDTEEYKERRDRNNVAVRKSRTQTKQKKKQTMEHMSRLRSENEQLEQQVQLLAKELGVLKDLFKMAHPMDAVDGAVEAGIQTDVDAFGAAQGDENAEHPLYATGWAEQTSLNIEVNARALSKDHEYVVKIESKDDVL